MLCRSDDKVTLFDVQQRNVLSELSSPMIKYVVWNNDMSQVGLRGKEGGVEGGSCLVRESVEMCGNYSGSVGMRRLRIDVG